MTNISQKWLKELNILVPFTDNYGSAIYGSKLAKISRLPQKTASRKLNQYCDIGFLKFRKEGNNKLYYLDLDHINTFSLIQITELYKGIKFLSQYTKIGLLINDLCKIMPIVLFGSYAKGYATQESDIDLMIIGKKSRKIKEIIGRYTFKVNAHYSTYDNFEKLLQEGNALAKEIGKNHIIFGDCERFMKILRRYCK